MRPKLHLLDDALVSRIRDEALQLLRSPGMKVGDLEAIDLLASAGATVADGVAHLPDELVRKALSSVPRSFFLYDRAGNPVFRTYYFIHAARATYWLRQAPS